MDRATFHKLCFILQPVCGLKSSRRVCVSEKGCLGALDGTHIDVHVPVSDKGRGLEISERLKAGFQRELENGMRKIIPSTDLVANPHINSKIYVWKKEYGALSDLLSKSGIGWNSTTSMLEIEDEGVWESCKRWVEIFGKDRATGENIVDPIDLINELYRTGLDHEGDTGDKYVPLTPEYMNDTEDDVADKHVDLIPKAFTKGKKHKSNDSDITMLVDLLGEFMKFSKSAMTDLCSGAEKGSTSTNDTKQLNCIMKEIVGLKVFDKMKVCDELVQNSKCLEFFLTLPLEE
ncbi:hypothetical protein ACS0TY_014938 [Phlomoides rotata]